MNSVNGAGYEFGKGVAKGIAVMLAVYFCAGFIFLGALELFEYGYDDTDGKARSGMTLHTDHKTGCQYLGGLAGGITPRLGVEGQHLGCRQ